MIDPGSTSATRWAVDVLTERGYLVSQISAFSKGSQSRVYRLEAIADGVPVPIALKVYGPVPGGARRCEARLELEALRAFAAALGSEGPVRCPTPIASDDDGTMLLTTWMEGIPLPAWLATPEGRRRRISVAALVVAGLRTYHHATGDPFGDFHSGNVLVGSHGIVLLDPTLDRPFLHRTIVGVDDTPLVRDVAYWTFTTCVEAHRRIVRHPARQVREVRFNRLLLEAACADLEPDDARALAVAVDATVTVYLDALPRSAARRALAPLRRLVLRRSITR